jgi:hypothetical protein
MIKRYNTAIAQFLQKDAFVLHNGGQQKDIVYYGVLRCEEMRLMRLMRLTGPGGQ